jgi:two-component system, NarL family, response regulator NreC
MKKVRILLVDDHAVVREGLRALIGAQPDLQVVGEAPDGRQALQKALELNPDIVLMDVSMPELDGSQTTRLLKSERPQIKVIALTAHEDETSLRQLCASGADGYVLKRSAADDLIRAIRAVAGGRLHFDATVAAKALATQLAGSQPGGERPPPLSEREEEVLRLLAWGYTNKEIATRLSLSVKTVETYKARIAEKSGLRSRTQMVQYALQHGWLDEAHAALLPAH